MLHGHGAGLTNNAATDEIANVTHDAASNERLIEYLRKRLDSPNADVKFKVLNVIKHVCRKGNMQFRKAWQRDTLVIKACLQFNCPSDVLRGDEPAKRVREGAKEALEAVFDSSRDERKDANLSQRIKGFGGAPPPPAAAQAATAAASGGRDFASASTHVGEPSWSRAPGGRYEGIGNPNFARPSNEPKTLIERVAEKVRERVEKYVEEPTMVGVDGVKPPWMTQGGGGGAGASGYNYASNRTGAYASSHAGSYDPTASQRPPQVWSDPRSPRVDSQPPVMGVPVGSSAAPAVVVRRTTAPSDGTHERKLVDELCAPGGVKPVPPKDKLEAFRRACRNLDAAIVVPILDAKLRDEDWKVQHKALCVLEDVLQATGLESYADALDSNPEALEALYQSRNPSVREKAKKVWNILYEDPAQAAANATASASAAAGAAGSRGSNGDDLVDLLGGAGDHHNDSPAIGTPDGDPVGGDDDMFQNLSVKGAPPPAAAASASNASKASSFAFLGAAAAPPSTAAPPSRSLLDDLYSAPPPPASASSPLDFLSAFPLPQTSFGPPPGSFGSPARAPGAAMGAFPPAAIASRPYPQAPRPVQAPPPPQQQQSKPADAFNFVNAALRKEL